MVRESLHTGIAGQLQDFILDSDDVEDFLAELAVYSASSLSGPGGEVLCGITLQRRAKATTVASSDENARAMDEVQYSFGDGPCLSSLRELETVHVPDLSTEWRWPDYIAAVAARGIGSILAVPFDLTGDAAAALNLYSASPHAFTGEAIGRAETFARLASKGLRVALRIAHLSEARTDLSAALESRTVIDLAVGAIMAQNRCSQEAAFTILRKASNARNIKLREVAQAVVASIAAEPDVHTHFEQ
jgi:ANTAR domain/GAF domain